MLKLIKFLKSLKAKGFASADEKAELKTLLKELTSEEQEEVKEEEAPVEDHNAETLVYSTDPEVEVEDAIEVEADDAE